jgi:hypothetical protein
MPVAGIRTFSFSHYLDKLEENLWFHQGGFFYLLWGSFQWRDARAFNPFQMRIPEPRAERISFVIRIQANVQACKIAIAKAAGISIAAALLAGAIIAVGCGGDGPAAVVTCSFAVVIATGIIDRASDAAKNIIAAACG